MTQVKPGRINHITCPRLLCKKGHRFDPGHVHQNLTSLVSAAYAAISTSDFALDIVGEFGATTVFGKSKTKATRSSSCRRSSSSSWRCEYSSDIVCGLCAIQLLRSSKQRRPRSHVLRNRLNECQPGSPWLVTRRKALARFSQQGDSGNRLQMTTSAGRLNRVLNFRTCFSVSLRCLARNIDTALSDPNYGIKSRCVSSCCSRRNRITETASAAGIG